MARQPRNAFQRSRRQIVAVVMTVLVLLFAGTLAAIYLLSYQELYQDNQDMLSRYVEQYRENGNPSQFTADGQPPGDGTPETAPETASPEENARYLLASFYSVAFDADGSAYSVDRGDGVIYSEEQLVAVAEALLDRSQGVSENFIYCVTELENGTLVALMDNTLTTDSFTTLFRNTLVLGTVLVLVLLVCTVALARWIIRPLEENDRRQRQFVSDASHELKTPVSVVEANAELLGREIGENKWLENIRSESSRMAELVNRLLVLARAEQAQVPMEPVDLSRLTLGGVLPFESVAFEKGLTLEWQVEESIVVQGSEAQLGQLVAILLDNAMAYSDAAGMVRVTLSRSRGGAVLCVSNPGNIPPEQQGELFTRFYRSDTARGDSSGHYGLGLSIAWRIVEYHRGEIGVKSENGTVAFTVRLPGQRHKGG